ncbi:hypothetical protein Pmani_025170 [Petrolisthes manimaculis]|uniref:Uncharacterized protein n=1 Tax=Petrolisthes manimaculis TaxID=1843537 RepID=A0AAE1P624_9EUCA|nr:hypothetical protein Pmani_025170 [Petrolisthes manimaculis]
MTGSFTFPGTHYYHLITQRCITLPPVPILAPFPSPPPHTHTSTPPISFLASPPPHLYISRPHPVPPHQHLYTSSSIPLHLPSPPIPLLLLSLSPPIYLYTSPSTPLHLPSLSSLIPLHLHFHTYTPLLHSFSSPTPTTL